MTNWSTNTPDTALQGISDARSHSWSFIRAGQTVWVAGQSLQNTKHARFFLQNIHNIDAPKHADDEEIYETYFVNSKSYLFATTLIIHFDAISDFNKS